MLLIEGPRPSAPSIASSKSHSTDAVSSSEASVNGSPSLRRPVQQPKVLEPKAALLLGHHQVPLVASPQLQITHIPDKLMPMYMLHHHMHHSKTAPKRIEKGSSKEEDRRQQQEILEMMKIHQRLLYTIIATIGIPVVLLVVFCIEVGCGAQLLINLLAPYIPCSLKEKLVSFNSWAGLYCSVLAYSQATNRLHIR